MNSQESMQRHMEQMAAMRRRMLWVHYLVIALGAWLLTSPFQLGLFDAGTVSTVRDISAERGLPPVDVRAELTGWNDIVCGVLLMLFGGLSISARFKAWQWGTTAVGLWLLFAPLLFWTPSAAAYLNDTIVGALAIALSVLIPMMPGMSHEGMMDESTIPAGWTYSPSSWPQRIPIIILGFFGFLIARYLAAYQLGHIDSAWDPYFDGLGALNGTEYIITSHVSQAWPMADAGLGATAYMIEALMGAMGSAKRWRTMPWMVAFFFILVVPLGGVSIFFIIIQPIILGTYCTLCLIQAFAMLIMIPLAVDEVIAMGQYMRRSYKDGRPLIRTFFQGGPDPASEAKDEEQPRGSFARQPRAGLLGVTFPWTLLAAGALGIWLMFSTVLFGTSAGLADSDHLFGALTLTVAVIALAEVARPLRYLNLLFGIWIAASPFVLEGAVSTAAVVNDIAVGLLIIALSLPQGKRSAQHYGSWDRLIV
ncbi:MAG TPA: vitamin K epoxide reductase family protein [Sphingomicrobium sp.]|nr:vitamin K epoxide reductase family protein [Sphingomicrobium sp.]